MGATTGIAWTDHTFNGWWGCARVSRACRFCLAPETRILYADMTWRPIRDAQPGDVVVSFTDTPALGANRVIERATIEKVWRTVKPTVELTVGDRTIIASADHKWLTDQSRPTWKTTDSLALGMTLKTLGFAEQGVDTTTSDYRAGYIAGVTTGDGTMRWQPGWRSSSSGFPQCYWRVAVNANDRAILDRLVEYLADFGIKVEVKPFDGGPAAKPMLKVETRALAKLEKIADVLVERSALDWQAGWLAGMFDTDGSYSGSDKYTNLRIAQRKENGALEACERYAANLGYALKREVHDSCPTVRLYGRVDVQIGFLIRISPALARKCAAFYGRRIHGGAAEVNGVRRGPVRELVDIQTSTGTFVAEGVCTHNCYAADLSKRFDGGTSLWGRHTPRRVMKDSTWNDPYRWNRAAQRAGVPAKVFASSMSDIFEDHPQLPELRTRLFRIIEDTPWLTWQLLTKRPENIAGMVAWGADGWPQNVWVGASVESQRFASERIVPLLRLKGAAVRFLSVEPMIGPVDLRTVAFQGDVPYDLDVLGGRYRTAGGRWTGGMGNTIFSFGLADLKTINWVIVGGESGPRPDLMRVEWARDLRDQCAYARTPLFFKQAGSKLAAQWGATGKGHDPAEWPESFPQDFPATVDVMAGVR